MATGAREPTVDMSGAVFTANIAGKCDSKQNVVCNTFVRVFISYSRFNGSDRPAQNIGLIAKLRRRGATENAGVENAGADRRGGKSSSASSFIYNKRANWPLTTLYI